MRILSMLVAAVMATGVLAGCVQDDGEPIGAEAAGWPDESIFDVLPLPSFDGARLTVDVPVPVLLVGYDDGAAAELQALLDPLPIDHVAGDLNEVWPPDPNADPIELVPLVGGQSYPMPVIPVANYVVVDAPAGLEAGFDAFLDDAALHASSMDRLSAVAAEEWFNATLPSYGLDLDPTTPAMIILHLDAFGVGPHEWQYALPHGTLDGEKTWGGKYPFMIFDASAKPDQYGSPNTFTGALGTDELEPLVDMLAEVTHYRLLQGAIYRAPQADCHAVTMVFGWRPTSLSNNGIIFNLDDWSEVFHPEEIGRGLENLTGQQVFVDTKILMLPMDDPALDAISRGEVGTMEVQRAWFEENWQDYHVAHEGCEPYLAFVVDGDAASTPTGILGIGTFDESKGHRIAFGWVNDALRYTLGDDSFPPLVAADLYGTKEYYTWIDYLFIHELGHIFTMRHAHDITVNEGEAGTYISNNNWEVVWDPMSYRTDGRVLDFGDIAANNYARNRAAFMIRDAYDAGLEGTDAWNEAWEALVMRDWTGVGDALTEPVVAASAVS